MATATKFEPFSVEHTEELGKCVKVNATHATLPESLLPKQVEISSTWVRCGGNNVLSYFLTADRGPVGIISLPTVPGDGESDLRQLLGWLERHGYQPKRLDEFGIADYYERA